MSASPRSPWRIGVLTTSRADFGIYQSVLKALNANDMLDITLFATGMHMSKEFGHTISEVRESGYHISSEFECLDSSDSAYAIATSMGQATIGMAKALSENPIDLLLVLGDRFEMAAAATAAIPFNIPLAHLHGGEETEGAIDNVLRHMLTKMSQLHFCATETSARRIRQMGEANERIIISGAPALDNILNTNLVPPEILERRFNIPADKDFLLITYHPVTLDLAETEIEIQAIFDYVSQQNLPAIFTAANADRAGRALNAKIESFTTKTPQAYLIGHMGAQNYYSAMNYAQAMIGNSSSGIIEAASFNLPVINIGARQKGRERSRNILQCAGRLPELKKKMSLALSAEFKKICKDSPNIYGDGTAANRIAQGLNKFLSLDGRVEKPFEMLPLQEPAS